MKNLKTLFVFSLVLLSFVSCSKDDDSTDQKLDNASLIAGTWRLISTSTNGVTDPEEDCQEFFSATFRDDLTLTISEKEGVNCDLTVQSSGTYVINSSVITITMGDTFDGEIVTLNATMLTLKFVANGITNVENYTKATN